MFRAPAKGWKPLMGGGAGLAPAMPSAVRVRRGCRGTGPHPFGWQGLTRTAPSGRSSGLWSDASGGCRSWAGERGTLQAAHSTSRPQPCCRRCEGLIGWQRRPRRHPVRAAGWCHKHLQDESSRSVAHAACRECLRNERRTTSRVGMPVMVVFAPMPPFADRPEELRGGRG